MLLLERLAMRRRAPPHHLHQMQCMFSRRSMSATVSFGATPGVKVTERDAANTPDNKSSRSLGVVGDVAVGIAHGG